MKMCPDCKEPLTRIQVADRGPGKARTGFAFTVGEAPVAAMMDQTKIKNKLGSIHGYLCTSCDRVLFYAHPGE